MLQAGIVLGVLGFAPMIFALARQQGTVV